jgi:hypothetical protein
MKKAKGYSVLIGQNQTKTDNQTYIPELCKNKTY